MFDSVRIFSEQGVIVYRLLPLVLFYLVHNYFTVGIATFTLYIKLAVNQRIGI